MATVATEVYPSYTSISSIKKYWLDTIAPAYFDFSNYNNYNVGIFGYINEVMGNSVEDTFNAVAITRREFYPVTAQFISSLYTMATLQSIEIPLTKPASCRCILIIPQNEIISNSTRIEGTANYECTIDDTLQIFAGDLQFMLDYPIRILSKQISKTVTVQNAQSESQTQTKTEWAHTIHYDLNARNSLNAMIPERYISSKVIKENGTNYVALFIDTIRQVTMEEKTKVVVKDTLLDTVTMDIDFVGNLANFEVFYKETANSAEQQLTKVMLNTPYSGEYFVQYELVNPNKIRLTFTYNAQWSPKFNSEIITRIYTSEGANGNFNQFSDDVVCNANSEKYPYNANMTIVGRISGSATGGANQALTKDFRNKVLMAYSTNNTISTENDLQMYFDDIADDINGVQILFKKKRDDVFIRLYGAYSVYTDSDKNIIPTNTLEAKIERADLSDDPTDTRLTIPAGSIFTYKTDDTEDYERFTVVPVFTSDDPPKIMTVFEFKRELAKWKKSTEPEDQALAKKIYFTNPFELIINLNPNSCGYYMNSLETALPIEYTFINDNSIQQFIASTAQVYRNSLKGNNFYRISIKAVPTTDIDLLDIFKTIKVDEKDVLYLPSSIAAPKSGMVMSEEYIYDQSIGKGYIRHKIVYDDGTVDYIRTSNTSPAIAPVYKIPAGKNYYAESSFTTVAGVFGEETTIQRVNDTYGTITISNVEYYVKMSDSILSLTPSEPSWKMRLSVGDRFNTADIIADGRYSDAGKVVFVVDLGGTLYEGSKYYIPMSIQEVDDSTGAFILEGYIATDDIIDSNGMLTLINSVYDSEGQVVSSVAINMNDQSLVFGALVKTDESLDISDSNSKFSDFLALKLHTHTNTYKTSDDTRFDLVTALSFTRSAINLYPIDPTDPSENENYFIYIDETPLIGAEWASDEVQFDDFIQQYHNLNDALNSAYFSLNNTFSIDSKFYNTYGKARFYTVGNKTSMVPLNNVRCTFRFAVKLNKITNVDDFVSRFKSFIRDYIETTDNITINGQDIYILSMVSAIEKEFDEIIYLEYHDFNGYGYGAQKIIGPDPNSYQKGYIPEFLNLNIVKNENGTSEPDIEVDIL